MKKVKKWTEAGEEIVLENAFFELKARRYQARMSGDKELFRELGGYERHNTRNRRPHWLTYCVGQDWYEAILNKFFHQKFEHWLWRWHTAERQTV